MSFDGATCTVRYLGEVAGTSGSWLGVEWDDAARGKHDGSHKGVRYFTCKYYSLYPHLRSQASPLFFSPPFAPKMEIPQAKYCDQVAHALRSPHRLYGLQGPQRRPSASSLLCKTSTPPNWRARLPFSFRERSLRRSASRRPGVSKLSFRSFGMLFSMVLALLLPTEMTTLLSPRHVQRWSSWTLVGTCSKGLARLWKSALSCPGFESYD